MDTMEATEETTPAPAAPRLTRITPGSMIDRLAKLMADGQARTLHELAAAMSDTCTEAQVSARMRDLRKPRYGSRSIACEKTCQGVYVYRMES